MVEYFKRFKIFPMNSSWPEPEQVEEIEVLDETTDERYLVVFNDDINTFDHVINTLMRVCKHSQEQAEQCTWIIHYKGKCTVKTGSLEELRPMQEGITFAGINAEVV